MNEEINEINNVNARSNKYAKRFVKSPLKSTGSRE